MAKRQTQEGIQSSVEVTEHKIEEFAEDLGKLLGNARSKAQGWMSQRQSIVEHLAGIRDTASGLLTQLGMTDSVAPKPTGGRPRGKATVAAAATPAAEAATETPGKKPRTMSPEARARISAAQKKRWAKLRKAQG